MSGFSWGRVVDRFSYDFDGASLDVTKFHPWVSEIGQVRTGEPSAAIEYHVEEMHESFETMDALLIAWIARRRIGLNQHQLVAGICRALEIN